MRKEINVGGYTRETEILALLKQGVRGMTIMVSTRKERCEACNGSGKEPAPPGIHKRCEYCHGAGWVNHRRL